MKTIEQLTVTDLNRVVEENSSPIIIWGGKSVFSGVYFYKDNKQMAPFFDKIKELLMWFDKSKAEIVEDIKNKYLETAREWAAEDSTQNSVSEDDFCNSLRISEIGFCIGDIDNEPSINIYLVCVPDYFSGHAICCYLEKDGDRIKYSFALEG